MQLINDLAQWRAYRNGCQNNRSIGFVPTMGALHAGHASLIKACQAENDMTVVSIFVNPTQFNRPDDLTHYPRTLDADLELLSAAGVDICFFPDSETIYQDQYQFQILNTELSQLMEGKHRPGHFTGVLTVVMKLLNIVKPSRAYFGEKDYQQFQLIHDMVEAFFMDIEIKSCPTIREPSGLALSSRNQRLTTQQHQLACEFAQIFHQPISIHDISSQLNSRNIHVDYVEEHGHRRFAAVYIGDIRLIDNYLTSQSRA